MLKKIMTLLLIISLSSFLNSCKTNQSNIIVKSNITDQELNCLSRESRESLANILIERKNDKDRIKKLCEKTNHMSEKLDNYKEATDDIRKEKGKQFGKGAAVGAAIVAILSAVFAGVRK